MNAVESIKQFGLKKPQTAEAWKKLIESRIELIAPFLDTMTLNTLGDLKFPYYWSTCSGPYYSNFGKYQKWKNPEIGSFRTQGLFILDNSHLYRV